MKLRLYNELAKYLPLMYSVKDYEKEVRLFESMFKRHKLKPRLIYDVACGFGPHAKLLMKKGYQVVGIDLNEGMLRQAKKLVPRLKVYKQDMRKLNMKKKADCIITMFNAINHLRSYKDFEMMLRAYKRNLNKGGLIIFDTMFDQKNWLKEYHNVNAIKKGELVIGRVDRSFKLSGNKGFVQQTFVVYEKKDKPPKVFLSKYVNFIYDVEKMKQIIRKLGFKFRVYYNFSTTQKKYSKNCIYVFVLQKSENENVRSLFNKKG